jgi:hypothetical protein
MSVRSPTSGADHTAPLGADGWRVWRWALLRAAGFPADGLDRFTAAETAAAADAYLRNGTEDERRAYDKAFDAALGRLGEVAHDLAGDPLFREAVTWQNPAVIDTMLDPLRAAGPTGPHNASRRQKERGIAQYWSRYCAKNDSIGFFGPVCWTRVGEPGIRPGTDPHLPPGVAAVPGPRFVKRRMLGFERWALAAYAERLAADPEIRCWLPVKLVATISLDGRSLRHPVRGGIALSRAEAAVAALCDGRRAIDIAHAVAGDPDTGIRRVDDAYLCLQGLVDRDFLLWGVDVPITMDDEAVLRRDLDAIDDPAVRARAMAGFDELCAGRDAVAGAAGDDGALRAAMAALAATFSEVTGRDAYRGAGQMYVGRTVCFEDTVRDLDVSFSQEVLGELSKPLTLLCVAGRWLSVRLAQAYAADLRAIYDDLASESSSPDVRFAELSFLAQGIFFGDGPKPVDDVSAEFTRRWSRLLRLDNDARELRLSSAELAPAVRREFDAAGPAWGFARYHSPDVHVLRGADGRVSFILGELHAAWNALDSEFFIRAHEDPAALLEYQARDVPLGRVLPVHPENWPRVTPRTCAGLRHPADWQLGFVPAPGAEPARLLPTTALTVSAVEGSDDLQVRTADGRAWPLTEVFAELLSIHCVDAFKLLGSFPHSPRVWIDNMVVARETWRHTVAELDFAKLNDERERYLRVREWTAALGLPDRVFAKISTEVKPIYVDFTSPTYIAVLCMAIRAGLRTGGPEAAVTISEMLPTPPQAWVPDAEGHRYVSELRLLVVDPQRAGWPGGAG